MKTVVLIDGGYLRASVKSARKTYDNPFIESFSRKCIEADEYLLRIFYYDSAQFRGTVQLPVSGNDTKFQSNDQWLKDLAKLERFAVRRGTIGFRGWRPKEIPIAGRELKDEDFKPVFEQKGVDMRIGLDIAEFAENSTVDRIVMVSGDTDMIPAMKRARKAGLEVVMVQLPAPAYTLHDTLLAHCDIVRPVVWP
ncbi:MAG: NYN domain-containing protein [Alphaproteobacteria bacterium]